MTEQNPPAEHVVRAQALREHVLANATRGSIDSVLATIDSFCWAGSWMMNVGDVKGALLDNEIRARAPRTVLELGTYCGYSAMRILRQLAPGTTFITIEYNPACAEVARALFAFAGVSDRIVSLVDDTQVAIPTLTTRVPGGFDLIFIDHWKDVYLRDIQLLEQHGCIVPGTVVVADNVIYPGAPDYLQYVRSCGKYDTRMHDTMLEYQAEGGTRDGVEVSVRRAD
eukprot:gnl/Spiro4/14953_TR8061_c0_g1_i1.p1 gnl/Spiro4/14953_TR8061_c0_g1~~gnl/Spiro4/14953_TR8061_c0_g1_i1.p1  ORF type:complete len:237 (+),score=71.90 gnl/Spiro4/14953_TR8061_c0_g1_i1:34-711(+)